MADLKISELATESPLAGTELVEVVTGGINKKTTTQDIADLGGGGGTWGSITGTLSAQTDLNTALGLKAPLASPALTGTPTAPTAAANTNTTQLATTAFVQQSKFVYYVNDYGLVADSNGTTGNGTDNATALGALVDLVIAAGGGTIKLGTGIYRYTGVMVKTGDNVTVEGNGMGISTLFCDNTSVNQDAWRINGNNCHYRNFTLQGRKTFQSAGVGLSLVGNTCTADFVEVKDANCFAIQAALGGNISITNCIIHDAAADGIHVSYDATRVTIANNTIYTCADDGIGVGFEAGTNNVVITGNKIYQTSAGVSIMGFSSSGVVPAVYNITVANNTIEETWLTGIMCHISEGSLENVNITGNILRNTGGFAPVSTTLMRGVGESYGIGLMAGPTDNTSFTMRNINVVNNEVFNARNSFISVGYTQSGSNGVLSNIKVKDNLLHGTITVGGAGAWGFGASGDSDNPFNGLYPGIGAAGVSGGNLDISGNIIQNAHQQAIRVANTVLGLLMVKNNIGANCNVATGTTYAFDIQGTSTTYPLATGNTYIGTAMANGIFNILNGTIVVEYDSPQENCVTVSGTSRTITTNDMGKIISMTNSAARAVTMPAANTWIGGKTFWVKDGNGNAGTNNITMTRAGSDTFEGGGTTNVINTNWGMRGYWHEDGSTVWKTR